MDKNFKFRLQNVLDLRIEEEEKLKHNFAKVQNEKASIENTIENMKNNYNKYFNIRNDMDLITQKITKNYLHSLDESIKFETKNLNKKKTELKEAKSRLIEKQVEKKSIEKLKEKKYKEYLEIQKLKEQALLDEFAMINYIRNRIEE